MSRDDDVIELGDDGCFEISGTHSVKQQVVEQIDYDSFNWSRVAIEEEAGAATGALESLRPGEYAIYKDSQTFTVVLRMPPGDALANVSYGGTELLVNKEQGDPIKVPLPDHVTIADNTLQCKHCGDLVSIRFIST